MDEAEAWWKKHRDKAPKAFSEALDEAFALLREQPAVGQIVRRTRRPGVRRLLMPRIHYYLYYRVSEQMIFIVSLWHARRSPPRI